LSHSMVPLVCRYVYIYVYLTRTAGLSFGDHAQARQEGEAEQA
jgi:hypothetical protein